MVDYVLAGKNELRPILTRAISIYIRPLAEKWGNLPIRVFRGENQSIIKCTIHCEKGSGNRIYGLSRGERRNEHAHSAFGLFPDRRGVPLVDTCLCPERYSAVSLRICADEPACL